MKKILILLFILFITISLNAEIRSPKGAESIPLSNYDLKKVKQPDAGNRDNPPAPDYSFFTYPTDIMTSYYDYMPGSYSSYPLRVQTDNGDGIYLTWFGFPSPTANRRQYYGYVDNTGSISSWGTISTYDITQGFGGIDIHPATGNCLATWHENPSGSNYGSTICYDDFALLGIPGFWSNVTFIESPLPNEYIWPYIFVGPHPTDDSLVRLYHTSKNYDDDPFGNPCEDQRIMFMDVENSISADLTQILNLNNWTTVTPMYYWRAKSCRPLEQAFAIDFNNPGKVAIVGYAAWLEDDLGDMPVDPGFFIWESYDGGATWDQANLHGDGPNDYIYQAENIPQFEDNDGNILDVLDVDGAGFHSTAQFDSDGYVHLGYMQKYGYTDDTGSSYYFNHFLPSAEAVWTGSEWIFREVPAMEGIDPLSGHTVPWVVEGSDTTLYTTVAYNKYPGESPLFHESTTKNVANLEKGWMAQLWCDGTYVQLAEDGDPNYQEYLEHPIIYLSFSLNNGATWSEPIELTDIYSTLYDFSDQITVYPYLSNTIDVVDQNHGKIYLYYLDDNSFGSFIQEQGEDLGGQIIYCSIEFPTVSVDDTPHLSTLQANNYPNPVTSSTTISFSSSAPSQACSVEIFNLKGQLVSTIDATLVDPYNGYAIWNGTDPNGNEVTNGIYLYKISTNSDSIVKKILLNR